MRHKIAGRRLGRDSEHHLAMRRNIVAALFEHETISTTIEKAKEVKPFAEKMITLAKKGTLAARRRAIAELCDRDIVTEENGQVTKAGTVIGKLFSEIGPRYLDRPGGYTRIIRLSKRRLGDNGQVVLLQLVGKDEVSEGKSKKKAKTKAKSKQEIEEIVEVTEDAAVEDEQVEAEQPVTEEADVESQKIQEQPAEQTEEPTEQTEESPEEPEQHEQQAQEQSDQSDKDKKQQ